MASRWDLANGWANGNDQGMFNPGDEPGGIAKWNPRPAFYYMYFFQKYFGDRMVNSTVTGGSFLASYASTFSSGQAGVVLVNTASVNQVVNVAFNNYAIGSNYYYYTLNGGTDNAPFFAQCDGERHRTNKRQYRRPNQKLRLNRGHYRAGSRRNYCNCSGVRGRISSRR